MSDARWTELCETSVGGPVTVGTMFGSKGLRTGTKFFAVWWHAQLVVKLPADRITQIVDAGDGHPFEPMEGRRMNGWVVVSPDTDWKELVDEGRELVESQQK